MHAESREVYIRAETSIFRARSRKSSRSATRVGPAYMYIYTYTIICVYVYQSDAFLGKAAEESIYTDVFIFSLIFIIGTSPAQDLFIGVGEIMLVYILVFSIETFDREAVYWWGPQRARRFLCKLKRR